MSHAIPVSLLRNVATHARNLAKAAEVVGLNLKTKAPDAVTLAHVDRQGQRFLAFKGTLRGAVVGECDIPCPIAPTESKGPGLALLLAILGQDEVAGVPLSALAPSGAVNVDTRRELAHVRADRDAMQRERDQARAEKAAAVEALAIITKDRDMMQGKALELSRLLDAAKADARTGAQGAELAEARAELEALRRTVARLRSQGATASPAPVQAEPPAPSRETVPTGGELVLRFPVNGQGKALRAARLEVSDLKGAGFRFRYDDAKDPAKGGAWIAPDTPEARAIHARLR